MKIIALSIADSTNKTRLTITGDLALLRELLDTLGVHPPRKAAKPAPATIEATEAILEQLFDPFAKQD
jgi:hypothetical protein